MGQKQSPHRAPARVCKFRQRGQIGSQLAVKRVKQDFPAQTNRRINHRAAMIGRCQQRPLHANPRQPKGIQQRVPSAAVKALSGSVANCLEAAATGQAERGTARRRQQRNAGRGKAT